MTIEQTDKIDALGIDKVTGEVVLTISDHLEWDDEKSHLAVLENKLNAYLGFLESGQLIEHMPEAKGRKTKIAIYQKFDPPPSAVEVLEKLRSFLEQHQIGLFYSGLPAGY